MPFLHPRTPSRPTLAVRGHRARCPRLAGISAGQCWPLDADGDVVRPPTGPPGARARVGWPLGRDRDRVAGAGGVARDRHARGARRVQGRARGNRCGLPASRAAGSPARRPRTVKGEPEPVDRLAVRHRRLRGRDSSGPVKLHPGICPRQRAASRAAPARSPRAGPLRLPRPWRRCRGRAPLPPLREEGPGSAPPSRKRGTGRRTAGIPGPSRRNEFPRADPPLAAPRDDWVPPAVWQVSRPAGAQRLTSAAHS